MGCSSSSHVLLPADDADLAAFVATYCELSPKAHVSYYELASALRVFLASHRGQIPASWGFIEVMGRRLIEAHGLAVSGFQEEGPCACRFVFVLGIRLKMFPALPVLTPAKMAHPTSPTAESWGTPKKS